MKNPFARCMASLCMAAGALAAAPAQAAYTTTIGCSDSVLTDDPAVNPGYSRCSGPLEGLLTGSDSESEDLTRTFGRDPAVGRTVRFKYFGKSNDSNGGPFTRDPRDPGASADELTFDPAIFLSLSRTFFVLGFESDSMNNFSYYLFNGSRLLKPSVMFDTRGITRADGSQEQLAGVPVGPNLAFAGLYIQIQPTGANVVPEPAGIALIATAFGALALTTRRRRS